MRAIACYASTMFTALLATTTPSRQDSMQRFVNYHLISSCCKLWDCALHIWAISKRCEVGRGAFALAGVSRDHWYPAFPWWHKVLGAPLLSRNSGAIATQPDHRRVLAPHKRFVVAPAHPAGEDMESVGGPTRSRGNGSPSDKSAVFGAARRSRIGGRLYSW